jgi:hypothetical protein
MGVCVAGAGAMKPLNTTVLPYSERLCKDLVAQLLWTEQLRPACVCVLHK